MVDNLYPKRSEWRRWNLHIHTPASFYGIVKASVVPPNFVLGAIQNLFIKHNIIK